MSPEFIARFTPILDEEVIASYGVQKEKLLERIVQTMPLLCGNDYDDVALIKSRIRAYQQMLLHRAIILCDGAEAAALKDNVYAMVLCIRAHLEGTVALASLKKRLLAAKKNHVPLKKLGEDVDRLLRGSRSDDFKVKSIPVKTLFDDAQTVFEVDGLLDQSKGQTLGKMYGSLCEVTHPNFASNFASFDLSSTNVLTFRYGQEMKTEEAAHLKVLCYSSQTFCILFDDVTKVVTELNEEI